MTFLAPKGVLTLEPQPKTQEIEPFKTLISFQYKKNSILETGLNLYSKYFRFDFSDRDARPAIFSRIFVQTNAVLTLAAIHCPEY